MASPDNLTAFKMWLGVATLFLFLLAGWAAIVVASRRAHIVDVPVSTQSRKP